MNEQEVSNNPKLNQPVIPPSEYTPQPNYKNTTDVPQNEPIPPTPYGKQLGMQEVGDNRYNPHYNPNDPNRQNLNNPNYNPNDPSRYPNNNVQKPVVTPAKIEPAKFVAVKGALDLSKPPYETRYPFNDLAVGDGYFVADTDVEGDSIDYLRKETYNARNYYSIAEHDENGDEVWETLTIKNRKITNGKFDLDDAGNYIMSATQVSRPKLIYSRHFSAIAVEKDADMGNGQKAPAAGVLVIREA